MGPHQRMYSYDRRTAGSEIQVNEVEFASGQEPEEAVEQREDFVTLVRVTFTVQGKALASLLKKQERALEKALEKATEKEVLHAAQNSSAILKELTLAIKKMVQGYVTSEGARASGLKVEFASESDLDYRAKIDPPKKAVRLELEFDVEGTVS
jgi:phosphoribosylaminoimidazole-succinocarboxamide synthase